MTEAEITNSLKNAICCMIGTAAGYTDERIQEMESEHTAILTELANQVELLSGLDAQTIEKITELSKANENSLGDVLVDIRSLTNATNNNAALIEANKNQIATVAQKLVTEVSRLEARIVKVEGRVDELDDKVTAVSDRVDEVQVQTATNTEGLTVVNNKVTTMARDVETNKKFFLSLASVFANTDICAVADECLNDYKSSRIDSADGGSEPEANSGTQTESANEPAADSGSEPATESEADTGTEAGTEDTGSDQPSTPDESASDAPESDSDSDAAVF